MDRSNNSDIIEFSKVFFFCWNWFIKILKTYKNGLQRSLLPGYWHGCQVFLSPFHRPQKKKWEKKEIMAHAGIVDLGEKQVEGKNEEL